MWEIGQTIEWYEPVNEDDYFAPLQKHIGEIESFSNTHVNVILLRCIKDTIIRTDKVISLPKEKVTKWQKNI